MVSSMCAEAGVKGEKSNHSLRVAGASSLFEAGVPERVIQERTGHKSIGALRVYEKVNVEQEEQVSKILCGSKEKFTAEKDEPAAVPPKLPLQPPANNQYHNCTVNMFQMPAPPDCFSHSFPPWMSNSIPSYALEPSSNLPSYGRTNQPYPCFGTNLTSYGSTNQPYPPPATNLPASFELTNQQYLPHSDTNPPFNGP